MVADNIFWIDGDGNEQLLSRHSNYKLLDGMVGRFMPPIEIVEEEIPLQSGSRRRDVKIKTRDVDLPLLITAESEIELRKTMRKTLRMINPFNVGKLKSIAADGSQRELNCQYTGGLEGTEDKDNRGIWFQKAVLVFHAFDPYWYDSSTIVQTFQIGEQPATFFPFFPLRLSSSTVFADINVNNEGDVETWPEWIITGPGEEIKITNETTNEVIYLEGLELDAGENITINTTPFEKTVTKNDDINLFYMLSDDSSLWALQAGKNSIRIEMANATIDSNIQLSYRNRYWGA